MGNSRTVLLIDDEVDLQQLVKITLKTKGYTIETANNGLEGLAKLENLKPDLIILDMNMPKMGGLEFYQKICAGGSHPKYPVLVLTARARIGGFPTGRCVRSSTTFCFTSGATSSAVIMLQVP